jgi:GAF domain-containing protein/signal transduction histidine kinase
MLQSPGPNGNAIDSIVDLAKKINFTSTPPHVEEIFDLVCSIAIYFSDADRATLLLLAGDGRKGTICAERLRKNVSALGVESALGFELPLEGFVGPALKFSESASQHDICECPEGSFRQILQLFSVENILIVPVVWRDRLLGTLNLDCPGQKHAFSAETIQLCELLASQVAAAVRNAREGTAVERRRSLAENLGSLEENLRQIEGDAELRQQIVTCAAQLCGWHAFAMYMADTDPASFKLKAAYPADTKASASRWPGELSQNDRSYHWVFRGFHAKSGYALKTPANSPMIFTENTMLRDMKRALVAKLATKDTPNALIIGVDDAASRELVSIEVEYLIQFIAHAKIRLDKQGLWDSVWEKLNLEFLNLLDAGPTNDKDLAQLLHTFLTMITAAFGLRFNRAILFTLNKDGSALEPRAGIGHFEKKAWEKSCREDKESEIEKFEKWVVTAKKWAPTPIQEWIGKLPPLPLNTKDTEIFSSNERKPVILRNERLQELPASIRDRLGTETPMILAPVHTGMELIGYVLADKRFTGDKIDERDQGLLEIMCKQVALAAHSYLFPAGILESASELAAHGNISNLENLSAQDVLRQIASRTRRAFNSDLAVVLLPEADPEPAQSVFDMKEEGPRPELTLQHDEISGRVMKERVAEVIEDVDPDLFSGQLRALEIKRAICLPLTVENNSAGVIWILYRKRQGRWNETSSLRFAAEASTLYANWLGLQIIAKERKAFQEIARATTFSSAVRLMVDHMAQIFGAQTATYWPFDARRRLFLEPVQRGFSDKLPRPSRNGATYRILEERDKALSVGDVESEDAKNQLSALTIKFLKERHLRSVLGMPVYSGQEPLGVLYITFSSVKTFGVASLQRLQTFANGAATLLYAVRVYEETFDARAKVAEVSTVLAMGDMELALSKVAKTILEAIHCDTVTIYRVEDKNCKPHFPPVVEGQLDRDRLKREDNEDASRIVPALVSKSRETVARNRQEMEPFRSRFVEAEKIQATIAIPLEFSGQKVGILFASFRHELQDAVAEVDLARMFSNHAAVAIGKSKAFSALQSLSANFVKADSYKSILQCAVDTVVDHLRPDLCNIVLRQNDRLRSVAQYGWESGTYHEIIQPHERSHAGFTMQKGRPVSFWNTNQIDKEEGLEGLVLPERLFQAGVISGLAVPIMQADVPQGAMMVYCRKERRFTSDDADFMISVTNQLMIAYRGFSQRLLIKAQSEVAEAIANPRDLGDERDMLQSILKLVFNHLIDEVEEGKTKVAQACVDRPSIRVVCEPPEAVAFGREHRIGIPFNARPPATLVVRLLPGRELTEDNVEVLEGIARIAGLGIEHIDAQKDSLVRLGGLAHLFTGSLSSASNLIEQMLRGKWGEITPNQETALKDLEYNVQKITALSEKIKYTMQALSRQVKPDLQERSSSRLGELLKTVMEAAEFDRRIKNIDLKYKSASYNGKIIQIDETMISVVMAYLIENAIKFSEPDQSIECLISSLPAGLQFKITDYGPGIAHDIKEKIFEPFYRARQFEGWDGVGVGLTICKKIITLHRGWIEAQSDGLGKGSTFLFHLPWAGGVNGI